MFLQYRPRLGNQQNFGFKSTFISFNYFHTVILTHNGPNIAYQTEETALWWIATTFTVKRAENHIFDNRCMTRWYKTILLRSYLENVVILWYSR